MVYRFCVVNSRSKGARYERTIATLFRAHGARVERQDQSTLDHGNSDLLVEWPTTILRVECKNRKTLPPKGVLDAYSQATIVATSSEIPVLIMHIPNSSNDIVCLELSDFIDLVRPPPISPTCGLARPAPSVGVGREMIR